MSSFGGLVVVTTRDAFQTFLCAAATVDAQRGCAVCMRTRCIRQHQDVRASVLRYAQYNIGSVALQIAFTCETHVFHCQQKCCCGKQRAHEFCDSTFAGVPW